MRDPLESRIGFIHLARQVIDCLGLPCPAMQATEGDALEIALRLEGEHVSLRHEPEINPGCLLMEARIGSTGEQPGAAFRLLAQNAALLEHGWLTLGSHAHTGEIGYLALLEIAAARADGIADCARALARRARREREHPQTAGSTSPEEPAPRPAIALAEHDGSVTFDRQVRALCEAPAVELDSERAMRAGRREVTLSIDGERVLLTHRAAVDSFYTARGVGDTLDAEVAETVARRLLRANAELAHDGVVAFALTPDHRNVIWRVTCRLPGPGVDEFVSHLRWAADMASCADSDRPPGLSLAHMLA